MIGLHSKLRKKPASLLFTFLLLLSGCASSPKPSPAPVEAVSPILLRLRAVSLCSSRIWPGFELSRLHIALIEPGAKELQVLYKGALSKAALDILPEGSAGGLFTIWNKDGEDWISVNPGAPNGSADLYELAVGTVIHEAYHHLVQTGKSDPARSGRATEYPLKWKPRYLRAMLGRNLLRALQSPGGQEASLAQARYWYEIWQKEFSKEVTVTTDGYEGTAQYAEWIGMALDQLGCNADESLVMQAVQRTIARTPQGWLQGDALQSDREGYWIGGTAALLLRSTPGHGGWEAEVDRLHTPTTILLSPVIAKEEPRDYPLEQGMSTRAQNLNKQLAPILNPTIDLLSSRHTLWLNLPFTWRPTSTVYSGMYEDAKSGLPLWVLGLTTELGAKEGEIRLSPGTVWTFVPSPCTENSAWTLPVRVNETKLDRNVLTVKTDKATGSLKGKSVTAEGKHWFCAGE